MRDIYKLETADEIVAACLEEAREVGGPFWCPKCGVQVELNETPCQPDYGRCGIIDLNNAT